MTPSPIVDAAREAQLAAAAALARTRWRVAAILTLLMVGVYFGFILLVAYQPAMLAAALAEVVRARPEAPRTAHDQHAETHAS